MKLALTLLKFLVWGIGTLFFIGVALSILYIIAIVVTLISENKNGNMVIYDRTLMCELTDEPCYYNDKLCYWGDDNLCEKCLVHKYYYNNEKENHNGRYENDSYDEES